MFVTLRLRVGAVLAVVAAVLGSSPTRCPADAFPLVALPAVSIGGGLPSGYESSGAVWHTDLGKLFVVDDGGRVSSMNSDGTSVFNWTVAGNPDLEGISVADASSDFVYIGVEDPDSIMEFDTTTGLVTRTFDLTTWMTGPSNKGLEALTFVPDVSNPEGGLFYAGLQDDGKIYTFELKIATSSTSTSVTHEGTITPVTGRDDISGLHYDVDNEVLYAIFDTDDKLRAMEADGTLLIEWDLPGNDQEGVALEGTTLFIAEDYGSGSSPSGDVLRYSHFPAVPEPSTFVLSGMGALAFLAYAWRRRRQW